jgi:FkbM family methyltransferase
MAIPVLSALSDRIRGWNRQRKARRQLSRSAVMTPHGFLFSGSPAMQKGEFEVEETELFVQLLENVGRFINVGANAGYYCCFAQQRNIETVAIEPIPSNVATLSRNMQCNGWGERITVLPVAVGDKSGFVDVYGEGTGASAVPGWANNPRSLKQTVPLVRLDDVILPPGSFTPTLVLMDIEGFELFALRGASKLLTGLDKPVWVVEIATDVHQPRGVSFNPRFVETFALMESFGYAAYEFARSFRPITVATAAEIAANPASYRFHGNYLFLEKSRMVKGLIRKE